MSPTFFQFASVLLLFLLYTINGFIKCPNIKLDLRSCVKKRDARKDISKKMKYYYLFCFFLFHCAIFSDQLIAVFIIAEGIDPDIVCRLFL